jgi:hypothetical protein
VPSSDPTLRLSVSVDFLSYPDGSVLAEIFKTVYATSRFGEPTRQTWTRFGQKPLAEEVLDEVETALVAIIDVECARQFGLQLALPS